MTKSSRRLFIVSNRLPVCVSGEKGTVRIKPATGGLVSAISSYLQGDNKLFSEILWTGVPGCSVTAWNEAINHLQYNIFDYIPVFVYKDQYEKYYNGFSNSVLWPLFHYFPSYAEYDCDEYEHYKMVNAHFAEVLSRNCREGDTIWVQDYHLLPLASILRQQVPNLTIGFFLHIPFPSYELFRLIPKKWQKELLEGMMGADLIGFHTIDYSSHFLECVQKVLGIDHDRNIIRHADRLLKVDVFPISIDFNLFHQAFEKGEVVAGRMKLREKMNGWKIIFSVDRLDYTKGVQNRLRAYQLFLEQNPEYHNKVVFIIDVVPSRDTIPKYAERKRMIDELISQINSRIGSLHWQPIIYRYGSLDFDEMLTLYTICDLALITPMRDGMNLVAKEFAASRKDKRGVLIISEMAGVARELNSAILINPNDVREIAEKIKEGLEMEDEEQERRMMSMQQRICSYDVKAWVEDFMTGLQSIKQKQQTFQEIFLDEFSKRMMYDRYRKAQRRLLLLDYDGTLISFKPNPENAVPNDSLLQLLEELSQKPETDVYLISGRSSAWLDKYFSILPINLIAEHGASTRMAGANWNIEIQTHSEWKQSIYNIMEMFVRRCPEAFIEEKEFSLVWHFRKADKEQGELRAQELVGELSDYIGNSHLQVISGSKIVEVRSRGIDKGTAIRKILNQTQYDFIFAVGDDKTDEDMFKTLVGKENCFTIKVGPNASYAQYNLLKPQMVISLLEGLNALPLTSFVH